MVLRLRYVVVRLQFGGNVLVSALTPSVSYPQGFPHSGNRVLQ